MYVPTPYVGLLWCADLSPVEAWKLLRRAIVNAAAKADCWPLIDLLHAAIVRSGPNSHSALVILEPLAPLTYTLLLQQRDRLLLSHLPGIDLIINWAAGTRIAETVGEVAVELRETWL